MMLEMRGEHALLFNLDNILYIAVTKNNIATNRKSNVRILSIASSQEE